MPPPITEPALGRRGALADIAGFLLVIAGAAAIGASVLIGMLGLGQWAALLPLTALMIGGVTWLAHRRGHGWRALGLRAPAGPGRLAWQTGLLLAVSLLVIQLLMPLIFKVTGNLPDISRFEAIAGDLSLYLSALAIVWLSAGLGEEMLFRGFLMHRLAALLSGDPAPSAAAWYAAAALQAVLFGALHAYQGVPGILVTGVLGFILGIGVVRSGGNLWPAILTHGLIDTISLTAMYLRG